MALELLDSQAKEVKEMQRRQPPPEIVHQVITHLGKEDLPSLACVNSTFQAESERLLYHTIDIGDETQTAGAACLRTLTAVPRTASLVRVFKVYFHDQAVMVEESLLRLIGDALVAVTALEQLYLYPTIYPDGTMDPIVIRVLAASLKLCTFSLSTLHINFGLLSLDDAIFEQPTLRDLTFKCTSIFGHRNNRNSRGDWGPRRGPFIDALSQIERLNKLPRYSSEFTVTCMKMYGGKFDYLFLYPMHRATWTATNMPKALEQDPSSLGVFYIDTVEVWIENLKATPSFLYVLRSMSSALVSIHGIRMMVKTLDPDDSEPSEVNKIAAALSNFSELRQLDFRLWDRDTPCVFLSDEQALDISRTWGKSCTGLNWVSFPDKTYVNYATDTGDWAKLYM
ncbi:hypothetical protein BDQ12DRAFT_688323 [Crucibulum laeve]|uniref:F-box domain-containing protein n=1 Tax=Crucibulum laeve TaxID=68775 RepID=A0A5C3LR34_9AGAR|nr:hypothetical protein BDQ12DRAFT_688323 [Crucibulum laeve]